MDKEMTLDCLCIKSMDYKENDKLITLYAFGEGKITATITGVKKNKAKLKYAGALLCFGKYYFAVRGDYRKVIGCDLIDSFYDIWTDVDKYYAALVSLEILDKAADDREIGDKVAVLTLNFLNDICYKNSQCQYALAGYLHSVLAVMGYSLLPADFEASEGQRYFYSKARGIIVSEYAKDSSCTPLQQWIVEFLAAAKSGTQTENGYAQDEVISLIAIYFDVISKNLSRKFKTFEQYLALYDKN